MAWCPSGDKPLSEPVMDYRTDAYESINLNELRGSIATFIFMDFNILRPQ